VEVVTRFMEKWVGYNYSLIFNGGNITLEAIKSGSRIDAQRAGCIMCSIGLWVWVTRFDHALRGFFGSFQHSMFSFHWVSFSGVLFLLGTGHLLHLLDLLVRLL